ncbi:MAG: hypothetical protein AAF264_04915 [Pseudomonadota bacterium]
MICDEYEFLCDLFPIQAVTTDLDLFRARIFIPLGQLRSNLMCKEKVRFAVVVESPHVIMTVEKDRRRGYIVLLQFGLPFGDEECGRSIRSAGRVNTPRTGAPVCDGRGILDGVGVGAIHNVAVMGWAASDALAPANDGRDSAIRLQSVTGYGA